MAFDNGTESLWNEWFCTTPEQHGRYYLTLSTSAVFDPSGYAPGFVMPDGARRGARTQCTPHTDRALPLSAPLRLRAPCVAQARALYLSVTVCYCLLLWHRHAPSLGAGATARLDTQHSEGGARRLPTYRYECMQTHTPRFTPPLQRGRRRVASTTYRSECMRTSLHTSLAGAWLLPHRSRASDV